MEKDPPIANPLQPLHLSYNIDHVTYVSFLLAPDELKLLESVLQQNRDVFTWTHSDMPSIRLEPHIGSTSYLLTTYLPKGSALQLDR